MRSNYPKFLYGISFLLAITTTLSHAEIILHGTRIIYPSNAREAILQLSNNGSTPALVQAWIDNGDAKSSPSQSKAPFMITPPISRVEASKGQTLRITALPSASALNQQQETVLWLNILDIPPKPSSDAETAAPDNFVQLAIRSRIKFFYRPASIKDDVNAAPDKLQWSVAGQNLTIKNPTPFHQTLISIYQPSTEKKLDLLPQGLMLKPFSEETVPLKTSNLQNMSFIYINDYGGRIERTIKPQ